MGNEIKLADNDQDCSGNVILIISTIVMQVLTFVVSAIKCREESSIFVAALANVWLSFLMWTALASQPDAFCNTLYGSSAATVI